jgi:predicted nucleic acid-binding Zn ribbon protein
MRSVGAALGPTLRALGISRRTRAAQACWLWPEAVGPLLARETAAVKLQGGTLWVTASSTPLAHQLHLERGRLIERLNAMVGAEVVREIRFRQGGAPSER